MSTLLTSTKPSDLALDPLRTNHPWCRTIGQSEAEVSAHTLTAYLQQHGDVWCQVDLDVLNAWAAEKGFGPYFSRYVDEHGMAAMSEAWLTAISRWWRKEAASDHDQCQQRGAVATNDLPLVWDQIPSKDVQTQMLAAAVEVARKSPCAKSKRGAVIFRADGTILGKGFNAQADGSSCNGSEDCRATCSRRCEHAEAAALRDAGLGAEGAHLLHVKVVDGEPCISGPPSCWQCSKAIVAARLQEVWLLHNSGLCSYPPALFHRKTWEAEMLAATKGVAPRRAGLGGINWEAEVLAATKGVAPRRAEVERDAAKGHMGVSLLGQGLGGISYREAKLESDLGAAIHRADLLYHDRNMAVQNEASLRRRWAELGDLYNEERSRRQELQARLSANQPDVMAIVLATALVTSDNVHEDYVVVAQALLDLARACQPQGGAD